MSDTMTKEEMEEMLEDTEALHKTWYELNTFLEDHDRNMDNLGGWDDIQLMHEFCKDHSDVIQVHVDDAHHCNSYLFLVPHMRTDHYMGATVIVVPQCCSTNNQFFLYPNDNRGLMKGLQKLEKLFKERGNDLFSNLYGDSDE